MTEEVRALVEYRLEEAGESLEEGKILMREGRHRGAVNRLYYACFYATLVLLTTKGLGSSKHSGVIALFHREFVKSGAFDKDRARVLSRLFDARVKDDYREFATPTEEEVKAFLPEVESFLREAQSVLPGS